MSQENVDLLRGWYAVYNAAMDAPDPQEALRVWAEASADPEIEWVPEASTPETETLHGVDGVMGFFDLFFDAFEYGHQWPERFIDGGDRVLVFVRFEAKARSGIEISEEWAHLVTLRNGRTSRLEQFRNRAEALEAAGLSE